MKEICEVVDSFRHVSHLSSERDLVWAGAANNGEISLVAESMIANTYSLTFNTLLFVQLYTF